MGAHLLESERKITEARLSGRTGHTAKISRGRGPSQSVRAPGRSFGPGEAKGRTSRRSNRRDGPPRRRGGASPFGGWRGVVEDAGLPGGDARVRPLDPTVVIFKPALDAVHPAAPLDGLSIFVKQLHLIVPTWKTKIDRLDHSDVGLRAPQETRLPSPPPPWIQISLLL